MEERVGRWWHQAITQMARKDHAGGEPYGALADPDPTTHKALHPAGLIGQTGSPSMRPTMLPAKSTLSRFDAQTSE